MVDKKLRADLFMFFSFVLLSVVVYIFHIIQSAGHIRGYVTGIALLIGWFIIQREKDRRLINLWGSFVLWVIHSNVYFDVRTHYVGVLRFIKHICFCILVFYLQISALGTLDSTTQQNRTNHKRTVFRKFVIILIYSYIALFPDISTNAYGNALVSILRVFCGTVLVMTRYKEEYNANKTEVKHAATHEFVWIFFVHDFCLLPLTILQLLSDIVIMKYVDYFPYIKLINKTFNDNPKDLNKINRMTKHNKLEQGMRRETVSVSNNSKNDIITITDSNLSRIFRKT